MIDTKRLERAINLTLKGKGTIHQSVRGVGKAPDHFSIDVVDIDTSVNRARIRIIMAWESPRFSPAKPYWRDDNNTPPLADRVSAEMMFNRNHLRLKWFLRVVDELARHDQHKPKGLFFWPDFDEFAFGLGDKIIWARLPVTVTDYMPVTEGFIVVDRAGNKTLVRGDVLDTQHTYPDQSEDPDVDQDPDPGEDDYDYAASDFAHDAAREDRTFGR